MNGLRMNGRNQKTLADIVQRLLRNLRPKGTCSETWHGTKELVDALAVFQRKDENRNCIMIVTNLLQPLKRRLAFLLDNLAAICARSPHVPRETFKRCPSSLERFARYRTFFLS